MRSKIEILVDSLDLCLPDCIPSEPDLLTEQKQLLIEARKIVSNYYNPAHRKYRILLNACLSILSSIDYHDYKEFATLLREFIESKICKKCDEEHEDEKQDCEQCNLIDWHIRDMRQYVELD